MMEKTTEKESKTPALKRRFTMSGKWPWLLSASLLPVAVMVYAYRQNMAHISGDWVPIVCLVFFFISALAWGIAYVIFRSPMSAFLSVLTCWVACFAANPLIDHLLVFWRVTDDRLVLFAVIAVVVAAAVGFFTRKLKVRSLIGVFILSTTGLLLLINIASVLVTKAPVTDGPDVSEAIKKDFKVDTREGYPNVYWFHCDGMLGFAAMEKYFGDPQADFINELNARGFEINRDAEFEAGHTTSKALPCLMSPYAYDTWISPLFTSHEAAMSETLYQPFSRLRSNLELTNAFQAGGYHTAHQCNDVFLMPIAEINYDTVISDSLCRIASAGKGSEELLLKWTDCANMFHLLTKYSVYFFVLDGIIMPLLFDIEAEPLPEPLSENAKLSIGLSENGARIIDSTANTLNDILITDNAPRFSILFYSGTHYPYLVDENGNIVHELNNTRVADYPAQHRFTAKTLINMVDMILEVDPDAVIVLQADHGLHGNTEEDFLEAFGTEDAALDMWNGVMSAMRVPEKYRNGDEHYALETPLNIARYLVNNFVGHNYAYIGE